MELKRMFIYAGLVVLLGLNGCAAKTGEPGPKADATEAEGDTGVAEVEQAIGSVWAFSNFTGDKLLTLEKTQSLKDPDSFTQAILPEGKVVPIRFVQHQAPGARDNGRQSSANFDQIEGDVFALPQDRAGEDATVLLITSQFLEGRKVLPFKRVDHTPLSAEVIARIEQAKQRKVASHAVLIELSPGRELGFVLFELKGKSALASLVLVTPEKLVFADYPAEYDEVSTWREGDNGEISADQFEVLFVLERAGLIELAVSNGGEEGGVYELFEEQGAAFSSLTKTYRYWSPE